jgi:ribosomal protein L29
MKITDIRKLSTSELTKQSSQLREEIVELRRSNSLGESQNVRLVRHKRKDLARVLTVLAEHLSKESI